MHSVADIKHSDFPEMDALLPLGFSSQQGDFGEGNPLVPCFKNQIQLSKIMERMLSTIFSSRTNDSRSHQAQLDYLNLELSRWQESLPDCAKWNKWEPPSSTLIPSVAALQSVIPNPSAPFLSNLRAFFLSYLFFLRNDEAYWLQSSIPRRADRFELRLNSMG